MNINDNSQNSCTYYKSKVITFELNLFNQLIDHDERQLKSIFLFDEIFPFRFIVIISNAEIIK